MDRSRERATDCEFYNARSDARAVTDVRLPGAMLRRSLRSWPDVPSRSQGAGRMSPAALQGFCKGDVHGVVGCDVLAQLPRTRQEIEVRVTMEVEIGEIRNRFGRAGR
jgi:hypothetical protein